MIYRLVQESLTNIARHAVASHAEISLYAELKSDKQGVTVKVHDNGAGFDAANFTGFGLLGMRERVESFNGDFNLQTKAGLGTTITAWIPLRLTT